MILEKGLGGRGLLLRQTYQALASIVLRQVAKDVLNHPQSGGQGCLSSPGRFERVGSMPETNKSLGISFYPLLLLKVADRADGQAALHHLLLFPP